MSTAPSPFLGGDPGDEGAVVAEIVLPVRDEQAVLEVSVRRLHRYLTERLPVRWKVTIVDNGSTDATRSIAEALAAELDGVGAIGVEEPGRGRAVRTAWMASTAQIVAYMDIDLSTDLDALLPVLAPLMSGHSDVSVGTRLGPRASVVRGARREFVSRSYNLLLATVLRTGFSDAQCGFKAVRGDVARALLPLVEDEGWFFDTELLVLAEDAGLRIHEVPVDWVDDPDSSVRVVADARLALRRVWRLLWGPARRLPPGALPAVSQRVVPKMSRSTRLVRFCSIGVVSSIVFAVMFAVLVGPVGATLADIIALLTCTVANTAANRRLTFDLRGAARRGRQLASGLVVGAVPLVLNLVGLLVLEAIGVTSLPWQLATLTLVNLVAATFRFVLLSAWVFRPVDAAGR